MRKKAIIVLVFIIILQAVCLHHMDTGWVLFVIAFGVSGVILIDTFTKKYLNEKRDDYIKRRKIMHRGLIVAVLLMVLNYFLHPCNYRTDKISIAIAHPSCTCNYDGGVICIYDVDDSDTIKQIVKLLKDYKSSYHMPAYDKPIQEWISFHNGTDIAFNTFSNYTQRSGKFIMQFPLTQYISEESYKELISLLEKLKPTHQFKTQNGYRLEKYIEDSDIVNGLEEDECKIEFN